MPKVRVAGFGVTQDGFSAGPDQSLENPLGVGGPKMFGWFFPTQAFRAMHGQGDGTTGPDNDFAFRAMDGFGAFILGRNMFGPVRGPWVNEDWKGWWGDDPPYHAPTFVLTHHARDPIVMQGGTTFYFVTGGIHEALRLAKEAAGEKDVKIGGGVSTVRQYLQAGLVDSMHLAIVPEFLGRGESLFHGIDLPGLGFEVTEKVVTDAATHLVLEKRGGGSQDAGVLEFARSV